LQGTNTCYNNVQSIMYIKVRTHLVQRTICGHYVPIIHSNNTVTPSVAVQRSMPVCQGKYATIKHGKK